MRRLLFLLLALLALIPMRPAAATSTIDTTLPQQGVPYNAAPIRENFGAAANDINALQRLNAGPTAPSAPTLGTLWLQTPQSGTTYYLKMWVPSANSWLTVGALDATSGQWEPPVGGGTLPNITSAATTDLGTVPNSALNVTGSQTIASFGATAPAGQWKLVIFTAAPTLVYNATYMILPGATNLTLGPGQSIIALSLGGGRWYVVLAPGTSRGTVENVQFVGDGVVDSSTPTPPCSNDCILTATILAQNNHAVLAGPVAGGPLAPTFRQLSCSDLSDAGTACTESAVSITATAPIVVTPSPLTSVGDVSITIPTADLLGGATGNFTSVTVGTNLQLSTGTLSVKGCGLTTIGFTDCAQTWTALQTFRSVLGSEGNGVADISGTAYTINSPGGVHSANSDCGRTLVFTSASPVTVTLDDTASTQCAIDMIQDGAGLVTMTTTGTNATLNNEFNATQSTGQYAHFGLQTYRNSDGGHAVYLLMGMVQ